MAVEENRFYVCSSAGAVVATWAAEWQSWIQRASGTAHTSTIPIVDVTTQPYPATLSFIWTDDSAVERQLNIICFQLYLTSGYGDPDMVIVPASQLVKQPGFQNRMTLDAQSGPLAQYDADAIQGLWMLAVPESARWLAVGLGNFDPDSADSSPMPFDAWNVKRCNAIANWYYGGETYFPEWRLTLFNVLASGLIVDAMVEADLEKVLSSTSAANELGSIAESLEIIANKDVSVSINRGAAIYSVSGGTVTT